MRRAAWTPCRATATAPRDRMATGSPSTRDGEQCDTAGELALRHRLHDRALRGRDNPTQWQVRRDDGNQIDDDLTQQFVLAGAHQACGAGASGRTSYDHIRASPG